MENGGEQTLQLVSFSEDGRRVTLNHSMLERVLQHPEVRDRRVVVVSAVGAYRRGKSFLLNLFIRYLRAQGAATWLDDKEDRVAGFTWRKDVHRVTTGIVLWPEAFIMDDMAVLLLDTQGTFDSQTSLQESTAVVAISALVSSVLLLNLSERIDTKDLDNLKYFLEYGSLAYRETGNTQQPFQHLLFLVRDWKFYTNYAYGFRGGQQYLDSVLRAGMEKPEMALVKENLSSSFERCECFLMPHPGSAVARDSTFQGRLGDVAPEFMQQLDVLVQSLLAPGNVRPKTVGGHEMRAKDLRAFFHTLVTAFNNDKLPATTTLLQMFAETVARSLVSELHSQYQAGMAAATRGETPVDLPAVHARVQETTLARLNSAWTLGSEALRTLSREQLCQLMEQSLAEHFRPLNEARQQVQHAAAESAAAEERLRQSQREEAQLRAELEELAREAERCRARGHEAEGLVEEARLRAEQAARQLQQKELEIKGQQQTVLEAREREDALRSEVEALQNRRTNVERAVRSVTGLLRDTIERGEDVTWVELHVGLLTRITGQPCRAASMEEVDAQYSAALHAMDPEDPIRSILGSLAELAAMMYKNRIDIAKPFMVKLFLKEIEPTAQEFLNAHD